MFAMHCSIYDVIMTRECSLNDVTFCDFDFFFDVLIHFTQEIDLCSPPFLTFSRHCTVNRVFKLFHLLLFLKKKLNCIFLFNHNDYSSSKKVYLKEQSRTITLGILIQSWE